MTADPENRSAEVFISYSWDTEDHVRAVLALSNRLRAEGVDCVLDQYEESPSEGWPRWMDRKIRDARLVLMICTETYYKRVMGDEVKCAGLGVRWEGSLIYQHLYAAGSLNTKFIPVLLNERDKWFIPTPVSSATHYLIDSEKGYARLYCRLVGRQRVPKPTLGERRPLPPKEVKTDFSLYISSPIDIELWNEAKWRGTIFLFYEAMPPILGLGFLNEKSATKIFEQWHRRYGERDLHEELRVAIVEGEIKGEPPGYTVHIGPDLDNTIRRYRKAGLTINSKDAFLTVSRVNRMNPPPESKNLEMFKKLYAFYKTYVLIPGVMKPDGSQIKPILELGIFKGCIHFRTVQEIGPNDIDSAVLGTGEVKRPLTSFGIQKREKQK